MALTQVGENYNVPAKVYYCDTKQEFDDNFNKDGDSTTPGTKVYILEENEIWIKGDSTWGLYNTGGGSGSGQVITRWKDYTWAHSVTEGF